jgi:TPR repeat protein
MLLGERLLDGLEVRQSYTEAIFWFRKAAEQGNAFAQESLGDMYHEGRGVLQDYSEAASWYRKAAEEGSDSGQYSLGSMYARGEGVPRDFVEAYMWLNLAAAEAPAGKIRDQRAKERDLVTEKMTAPQITEGQRRAREWNPKGWAWKFPYRDRVH